MRLLETSSLTFHEFLGSDIPPYAILSHTWGNDEVLYQHFENGTAHTKLGYRKVWSCCKLAAGQGYEYVWIDTCNIDKRSSAELQEAINSMFKWYQRADVCFVYLADVTAPIPISNPEFASSRWFTRGWTLQELIAPTKLQFYSRNWQMVGGPELFDFEYEELEAITGIRRGVLTRKIPLSEVSLAERMSWAADRKTTREEDIAYCLLGIFDVNIPLLYGEGKRAFIRLQEEIMKSSDDTSIFAWEDYGRDLRPFLHGFAPLNSVDSEKIRAYVNTRLTTRDEFLGLLASSPDSFRAGSRIELWNGFETPTYSTTNKGLQITLKLEALRFVPNVYVADLNCLDTETHQPICILLMRLSTRNEFARICPGLFTGVFAQLARVQISHSAPVKMSVRQNVCDRLRTIPQNYEIEMYTSLRCFHRHPDSFLPDLRGHEQYSLDIIASHPKLSGQFQPHSCSTSQLYKGKINYALPIQLCGVFLMEIHGHDRKSDVIFMVGLDYYSHPVFKAFEPKATTSDPLNGLDRNSYARRIVSNTFANAWRTQDFPSSSQCVLDLGGQLSLSFRATGHAFPTLCRGTIDVELVSSGSFVEDLAVEDSS